MKRWVVEIVKIVIIALLSFGLTMFALRKQGERFKDYIDDWKHLKCIDEQQSEIKVVSNGGIMRYG